MRETTFFHKLPLFSDWNLGAGHKIGYELKINVDFSETSSRYVGAE